VCLGDEDPRDPATRHRVDVSVDRTLFMRKVGDQRAHRVGRDLVGEGPQNILGHPGGRNRRYGVDLDAVAGTLEREDPGQPGQACFGRAVVGLTEVAEKARGRARVDDAAVALLAHQTIGRLADVESSLEVDVDHRLNHGVVHLVEGLVAQDARVVDQDVDTAERIDRGLHDRLPP
jgi:hypothetical protein